MVRDRPEGAPEERKPPLLAPPALSSAAPGGRSGEDGANWLRRFMSRIEDMAHGYPSRSERLK